MRWSRHLGATITTRPRASVRTPAEGFACTVHDGSTTMSAMSGRSTRAGRMRCTGELYDGTHPRSGRLRIPTGHEEAPTMQVADVMHADVKSADAEDTFADVAKTMRTNGISSVV